MNSGPTLGPLAPRPTPVPRGDRLVLSGSQWEDGLSQPGNGLRVCPVLPFIVFSFTGSVRDSVPKTLSEGVPDLGRRLDSDPPRARRDGVSETGRCPERFLASDFYPGLSPLSRVVVESPIIFLDGLGTGTAISTHWGVAGDTP